MVSSCKVHTSILQKTPISNVQRAITLVHPPEPAHCLLVLDICVNFNKIISKLMIFELKIRQGNSKLMQNPTWWSDFVQKIWPVVYVLMNSYGHGDTVSSPSHTFFPDKLD